MVSFLILDRVFFFFKQKTAYEMRISDWSSDVCSSDLIRLGVDRRHRLLVRPVGAAVAPLGLAFLYASGVRQHVIKQVAGGGGAPYRAAIALGHKLGQQQIGRAHV